VENPREQMLREIRSHGHDRWLPNRQSLKRETAACVILASFPKQKDTILSVSVKISKIQNVETAKKIIK